MRGIVRLVAMDEKGTEYAIRDLDSAKVLCALGARIRTGPALVPFLIDGAELSRVAKERGGEFTSSISMGPFRLAPAPMPQETPETPFPGTDGDRARGG